MFTDISGKCSYVKAQKFDLLPKMYMYKKINTVSTPIKERYNNKYVAIH